MVEGQVRAFIRNKNTGQVGCIIANEQCGGVYRGHAEVWFGSFTDAAKTIPKIDQVSLEGWEEFPAPFSFQQ